MRTEKEIREVLKKYKIPTSCVVLTMVNLASKKALEWVLGEREDTGINVE